MIFSNKNFKKEKIEMSFGEIQGFYIGEEGRGRKEVFIPSAVDIKRGMNQDLSVVLSRTGKPKIVEKYDSQLYAIISTHSGYTRRGLGYIIPWKNAEVEILAQGKGADGDAGGIGTWTENIVKMNKDACLKVSYSGGSYSNPHGVNWFMFVWEGKVEWVGWKYLSTWIDTQTGDLPEWINLEDKKNLIFSFDGDGKKRPVGEY